VKSEKKLAKQQKKIVARRNTVKKKVAAKRAALREDAKVKKLLGEMQRSMEQSITIRNINKMMDREES
jgi:predicted transcriptional regulator